MNEPCDLLSVFDRFLAFERAQGLFAREACGVRFWHFMRFQLYSGIILPHYVAMGEAHPDVKFKQAGGAKRMDIFGRVRRLLERVRFDPLLAFRRREVLVALAPRVTRLANGRRVRLATDFFLGSLQASHSVLEYPLPGSGYAVHDGGGRIFRWTQAQRVLKVFKESKEFLALSGELEAAAGRLSEEIASAFGVDVDRTWLVRKIGSAVAMDRVVIPLLRAWLKRLGVRCVVEVVHYAERNFALTRAAHDLGIPVVELQHGTVYPAHAAYNLPVAGSPYSPDYLLGWGDYWLRQTRNFPAKKAVSVGYPFLERALADNPRKVHGGVPLVLFISQGTIGKRLSELAAELGRISGNACRIVFKPHPNEMKSWRRLYPALSDSGVEVAEDAARGIYSWLAEADAVAGVYSTAMIEGLVWGTKAYVFRSLPGADTMASFCSGGAAEYVDGAEDLAARLRLQFAAQASGAAPFDRTEFFADNAAANVVAAIDRIVEGKEP